MSKHRRNTGSESRTLSGTVRQHNFSPKGEIEGLVLETEAGPVQVNFPHGPRATEFPTPVPGSLIRFVVGADHRAAEHDPGDHPVCEFVADADAAPVPEGGRRPATAGVVIRLNYARHGEPNGVVLDTGDFVHLKPHGMRLVPLALGARVVAEGASRPTVTGHRVIEASVVNGVEVVRGDAH
ncbi:hypothetical protein J8F10_12945 [Gemmata sp. G18]|uniref:Gp5/Type VI secretion system Vgr protein OB-fold domain-containing protein n=1 Tax=Gemmata palustris TaxID=2822762 RepID=A0ABS5BR53_9BACT|nr:hypothetical protein [Gemmata palustris]MBP3956191.1 hypothetical protein [Gemmata palustris]